MDARVNRPSWGGAGAVLLAIAAAASGCAPSMFEADDHDSSSGSSAPTTTSGGSTGLTTGGTTSGSTTTGGTTTGGTTTGGTTTGGTTTGAPAFGGSSNGSGGGQGSGYLINVPSSYSDATKAPVLLVFSGVEGDSTMMSNLRQVRSYVGMGSYLFVVLDGSYATASDGAAALDDVRRRYNVDNDRTVILTESAGTRQGLTLAFQTRQAWFAGVWANDPVATVTPSANASTLGFSPWGSAGGGTNDIARARSMVSSMQTAGYRTQEAYYDPSVGHGSSNALLAGLQGLAGKSRK